MYGRSPAGLEQPCYSTPHLRYVRGGTRIANHLHPASAQIVLNSRVPIVEKAASVVMDVLGDLVLKVRGKITADATFFAVA